MILELKFLIGNGFSKNYNTFVEKKNFETFKKNLQVFEVSI